MSATTAGAVWLGHCRMGGRLYLRRDELYPGMNLIGNGTSSPSTGKLQAATTATTGEDASWGT